MEDCWLSFDEAIAQWQLGERSTEELAPAAVQALVAGCDSPALAQLAGMEGSSWSEIAPIAHRVLAERGRSVPDQEEAVRTVANGIVRRIVSGEAVPEQAARRLNLLAWRVTGRPAHEDLWPFAGLWSSMDLVEAGDATTQQVRSAIVSEAAALLERGGVR